MYPPAQASSPTPPIEDRMSSPSHTMDLHKKMSFSSVNDIDKQLFHKNAFLSSHMPVPFDKQEKHPSTSQHGNGHTQSAAILNGEGGCNETTEGGIHCDKNSNKHHTSMSVPNSSVFHCDSLKTFSSQIQSSVRCLGHNILGSETEDSAQHNYRQLKQQQDNQELQVWYCVQFRRLCQLCLIMPLIGLVGCLIVACVFQFGDIQETACKVSTLQNFCVMFL